MAKINLPKELLQKEAFKSLPSREKGEYLGNLLSKLLELNPDGITIHQIKDATGFTYSTIWHHLEVLSCTAQANKASRGNLDVYHHIGFVNHLNEYAKGGALYSVSTVENAEGKFVFIHEKKENRSGNKTVCRGISIPIELIDNILKTLSKLK